MHSLIILQPLIMMTSLTCHQICVGLSDLDPCQCHAHVLGPYVALLTTHSVVLSMTHSTLLFADYAHNFLGLQLLQNFLHMHQTSHQMDGTPVLPQQDRSTEKTHIHTCIF